MARGQKNVHFNLLWQLLAVSLVGIASTGCASSTFSVQEHSALNVVGADASRSRALHGSGAFELFVRAPAVVREGEAFPMTVQLGEDAFVLVCQQGFARPIFPSLAFPKDWPQTPRRRWDVRLPWILSRKPDIEYHILAFKSFEDFDSVRYGIENEYTSCPLVVMDYETMFPTGSVVGKTVLVHVQR